MVIVMISTVPKPFTEFKGHTYIHVTGDAETPPRFWTVRLITADEYLNASKEIQQKFRRISDKDKMIIQLHFGE